MKNFNMQRIIETEIIQLHHFFQEWFNGDVSLNDVIFSRLSDTLAPEFIMITPEGKHLDQKTVLESVRVGYGKRKGMQIWIKNVTLHHQIGDIAIATYEEWQDIDGRITTRISSAIFSSKPGNPNNINWLHLHETWKPIITSTTELQHAQR